MGHTCHFIERYECGHILAQCRCADANKTVIVVPGKCPQCELRPPTPTKEGA